MGACCREISTGNTCLLGGLGAEGRAAGWDPQASVGSCFTISHQLPEEAMGVAQSPPAGLVPSLKKPQNSFLPSTQIPVVYAKSPQPPVTASPRNNSLGLSFYISNCTHNPSTAPYPLCTAKQRQRSPSTKNHGFRPPGCWGPAAAEKGRCDHID